MKDLQARVNLLLKEAEVNNKGNALEFQRIAGAFQKFGNLVDLLYLEVAVLLDVLSKKEILTEEEFAKQLEETSKNIVSQNKKMEEERAKTSASKILSGSEDNKKEDEPKTKSNS